MAERELGYTEAPAEMFANDANVRQGIFGAQFNVTISGGEVMADFNGSKPVQTVRDNEFKIQLVDGASGESATAKLSILAAADSLTGKYGVLVYGEDGSGNAATLPIGAAGVQVEASDLDIRDLAFATDSVDVSGSSVNISDNGGSITVDATDLDIRDLVYTSDSVTAHQGGAPWTVSATDLDIRDLTHASDSVKVGDGTDFLAITGDGEASVQISQAQGTPGSAAPSEAVLVGGSDGTNLRALKTDSAGRLEVISLDGSGTDVCDYQTSATVGVNSTVNHDYVVPSGYTFYGQTVLVGARGAVKVAVGTWNGSVFTTKAVWFQDPKENIDHNISRLSLLGDGTAAIRIAITNLDGTSSDLYSNLSGDYR